MNGKNLFDGHREYTRSIYEYVLADDHFNNTKY